MKNARYALTASRARREAGHRLAMVRAFDGEPRALLVVGIHGSYMYVAKELTKSVVGIESDSVFEFDEPLFERINSAFLDGNNKILESLWKTGKNFSPTSDENNE